MNEFGDFIKFNRKSLGMTAKEFAKLVGCATSTITNYEYGIKVPKDTSPFETRVRHCVKREIKRRREVGSDELEPVR